MKRWLLAGLIAAAPFTISTLPALAGAQEILPGAVPGWHRVDSNTYDRNTLFNLVDGEAEAIMEYTFSACASADYAPAGVANPEVTVTVFDMTDSLDAFGLFGSDRLSGRPGDIGVESVVIDPTGLDFWKGRYVVRSTILHPTPANKAALHAFAAAAARNITGGGEVPALVRALPPGRQPRSEKYVRRNVAGQSFLSNAITARYPALGQGAELFIAQYPGVNGAHNAFNLYWNTQYTNHAAGLTALTGLGGDAFLYNDRYMKNVVVVWKGRYIVGVHHARDASQARQLVQQALVKLG